MSQHDLARAVRMPQPSIARIERGTVIPRTATLMLILRAAGHQLAVEPIGSSAFTEGIRERQAMDGPTRTWTALGKGVARHPRRSPLRILRRLRRFGVAFVLIGDLAEVAHGSPLNVKRNIDVCVAQSEVARERLGQALQHLGATSSDGLEFKSEAGLIRPVTETAAGDYEVLARTAVRMHVDSGLLVSVASLSDLIRIRMARIPPADREAVALLRAIGE